MLTFPYIPTPNFEIAIKPRKKVSQFGDGYMQRTPDGINSISEEFSVSFEYRTAAERDAASDFLKARGGVEAFLWVPPDEVDTKKFICESWRKTKNDSGVFGVVAMFKQVFDS